MSIEVTNSSGQLVPSSEVTSLLLFAMTKLNLNADCDLSVGFIDDEYMSELHNKWMNELGSTDVLSFPMDMPENDGDVVTLGDIMISPLFAATQAQAAGHTTEHEIYILAVHGLLHIVGYDHAEPDEERIMFSLQEEIVENWKKTQ
ncbi:MAG: rRNA maturation RNase YbeY [Candidatus Planktophila sp.]|nr:rRNA maturation RNase YbeY [Candidatus Planktophila sp.]